MRGHDHIWPGVVIQLNSADEATRERALRNAGQLLSQKESSGLPVELVVYGPAIPMCLPDHPMSGTLADLIANGVDVLVCEFALSRAELTVDQLAPNIRTVPSAVVQLTRRQLAGWAYLHP